LVIMLDQMMFSVVRLANGLALSIKSTRLQHIKEFAARGILSILLFKPFYLVQRRMRSLWTCTIKRMRNRMKKKKRKRKKKLYNKHHR